MAPKVIDIDLDKTDSECEETPTGPEVSSAVTHNQNDSPSVLETSFEHTQAEKMKLLQQVLKLLQQSREQV